MMTVIRNNKGLTLVEILISLVITLVVFLGLLQTALLSMDVNVNNALREEAVSIAESRMRELRELPDANLPAGINMTPLWGSPTTGFFTETRRFRNMPALTYTLTITVTNIPVASPVAKQLEVLVTWATPKEPLVMLSHTITTMKRL